MNEKRSFDPSLVRKTLGHSMYSACEQPLEFAINYPLLVLAFGMFTSKLRPTNPHFNAQPLNQQSGIARRSAFVVVMRPNQGQRCQHYVFHTKLKLLSPQNVSVHPSPFFSDTPFSTNSHKFSLCAAPNVGPHPPFPVAFTAFLFWIHKESLPHLDWLYAVMSTETAAGCECQRGLENRLRLSSTPHEIAK